MTRHSQFCFSIIPSCICTDDNQLYLLSVRDFVFWWLEDYSSRLVTSDDKWLTIAVFVEFPTLKITGKSKMLRNNNRTQLLGLTEVIVFYLLTWINLPNSRSNHKRMKVCMSEIVLSPGRAINTGYENQTDDWLNCL